MQNNLSLSNYRICLQQFIFDVLELVKDLFV